MALKHGYKQTELGVIPAEWECGSLEEFFSFISYGFTNPMPTVSHGIYMITAADINDGRIQLETARKTTEVAYRTLLSPKSKPKKNDILLTKDGSLGRLALVGDEQVCINQSVAVIRPNEKVEPIFLKLLLESPRYQKRMIEDAGGSTIKHIYITIVNLMQIAVPPNRDEQLAIATALSDMDALLGALERLIAKKRNLKQASMQQLLTGQTRLPGFDGGWEMKRLGDILTVRHGKSQHGVTAPDGKFPILASGGEIGRTNSFIYDKPSVLIGRKGTIDSPQYVDSPFWTVDTLFYTEISSEADAKFVFYKFVMIRWRSYNEASGVPSLNAKTIENIEIKTPHVTEQTAIATVLSDMDAELAALEQRLTKTRALKQGMMQELLTGRTRLL
jgi:type I restriction enzyme S subunit